MHPWMNASTPLAYWSSGLATWRMLTEAQTVVALRMAGMAGLWTMAPGETTRMITEKQTAFAQAAAGVARAAASGASPERILDAAVAPLGRATRANAKRLGRAIAPPRG